MTDRARDTGIWMDIQSLLPAWTWETDADYRLSYVQDSVSTVTGIEVESLLGFMILLDEYEEKGGTNSDSYVAALRRQDVIECVAYERVLLNGEKVVLVDNAVPRFDGTGDFQGYRGVSLNLTEVLRRSEETEGLVASLQSRTRALEAELEARARDLESSNRLLSGILDAMAEGVLVTSSRDLRCPDNRVLMFNPAYRDLFGLSDNEIHVGMAVPDLSATLRRLLRMPDDAALMKQVAADLETGEEILMEIPSLDKVYYVRATPGPSGGYVLVHTDVTQLEQNNVALRAARDAAEVASLAKSNFLATMSHEIRTPMNGVVGMADILSETPLDAEQAECVETIRGAALALTSMISDILDFSKVEAGRLEIDEACFDLHALVAEVCDLLMPLAGGKGLELTRAVAGEVPCQVEGDGLRLRQVLLNLMGNAIKFTESGSVGLNIAKVAERDNRLIFAVRDTGIGIPADQLASIFDPFEQVQSGQGRRFEGTGLGLAISRRLVEAMGGTIAVRSALGEGSVFEVVLPLPGVANCAMAQAPPAGANLRLDGLRILLVEDNRTNRMVVEKMLVRRGALIETAQNGKEAVARFAPDRFDLVLMDISMPVMTGLEATRAIRRREAAEGWPHRPIVALTGNAFEKDRADARAAGMDDFLTKPVRRDALLDVIHQQIHGAAGPVEPLPDDERTAIF